MRHDVFDRLRNWLASRASGRAALLQPESRYVVTVDETRIECRRPDGKVEAVEWAELDAVVIETNDTGPWGADVLWLLAGRDGRTGCVIPQGATGEGALLDALQRLPGFDNEALIAAMGCTDNRQFLCWRRPPLAPISPPLPA